MRHSSPSAPLDNTIPASASPPPGRNRIRHGPRRSSRKSITAATARSPLRNSRSTASRLGPAKALDAPRPTPPPPGFFDDFYPVVLVPKTPGGHGRTPDRRRLWASGGRCPCLTDCCGVPKGSLNPSGPCATAGMRPKSFPLLKHGLRLDLRACTDESPLLLATASCPSLLIRLASRRRKRCANAIEPPRFSNPSFIFNTFHVQKAFRKSLFQ